MYDIQDTKAISKKNLSNSQYMLHQDHFSKKKLKNLIFNILILFHSQNHMIVEFSCLILYLKVQPMSKII